MKLYSILGMHREKKKDNGQTVKQGKFWLNV